MIDTTTQVRAIRQGIKALHVERIQAIRQQAGTDVLHDIDQDIAALEAAVRTIQSTATFRSALSTFIAGE